MYAQLNLFSFPSQRIFEATEALRASAETFDRFFRAGAPINDNTDSGGANPRKGGAM